MASKLSMAPSSGQRVASPWHDADTRRVCRLRQYRSRISQWGQDKNVKPQEMQAIVRKYQKRKLIEPHKRRLVFEVRGTEVDRQKIERWMKRHGALENLLYASSSAACRLVRQNLDLC